LITTGTICDIFENQGDYLILAQSIDTEKVFNPLNKIKLEKAKFEELNAKPFNFIRE
jgi:hypothetical protein